MTSFFRVLRSLALVLGALVTLLTGCGGGLKGGTGLSPAPSSTPASPTSTLEVQIAFPSATAKSVPAIAATFSQTARVTVNVLDPATHQPVVAPVTQDRPAGAATMTLTIPGLAAGAYVVYVQCFDANGQSCGDTVPQATMVQGETVTVPVTGTVALMSVAVTPSTATIAVGGMQQFTAIATYADSSLQDATYIAAWSAIDAVDALPTSTCASIDVSTGLATGLAWGIARITATVSGVTSANALLTVVNGSPSPPPTPPSAWSSPHFDLTATGENAEQVQVAASADGTKATAIWQRNSSTGRVIQTASATISGNTASWGATQDLYAVSGVNGQSPQIAVSADGTLATAVWVSSEGSNAIVQSASATISGNTATWGTLTALELPAGQSALPQIGLSADGTRATAVWSRFDGADHFIEAKSATITGTSASWGTLSTPSAAASQQAKNPQVATSADGTMATAVWIRNDGSKDIVRTASATISGSSASWSTETDLSAGGQNAAFPDIATSADGTMVTAVWTRFINDTLPVVQSASATISGNSASWGSTTDLVAVVGQASSSPQVALAADGSLATVVWLQGTPPASRVVCSASATVSGNTATWGSFSSLSDAANDSLDAQVNLSADGTRATAVWTHRDGSFRIIQSASALIGGSMAAWGIVSNLSATGQECNKPQVAASADGTRATAVWYGRGANNVIQTASYGPPSP